MSSTRWLYCLVAAGALCTAILPAVPAQAAHSSPVVSAVTDPTPVPPGPPPPPVPPNPPPGGKVYGQYKQWKYPGSDNYDPNGNYCNSILRNFRKQGAIPQGWGAACFPNDDGYWYIMIWPPQQQQTWQNGNSNLYLEVYHSSLLNRAPVDQWGFNGSSTQYWVGMKLSDGTWNFLNGNSGFCLSLGDNGSTAPKTPVVQYPCIAVPDQRWNLIYSGQNTPSGNPEFYFLNVKSQLCLDVPYMSQSPGVQLWEYPCNGTGAQLFY